MHHYENCEGPQILLITSKENGNCALRDLREGPQLYSGQSTVKLPTGRICFELFQNKKIRIYQWFLLILVTETLESKISRQFSDNEAIDGQISFFFYLSATFKKPL